MEQFIIGVDPSTTETGIFLEITPIHQRTITIDAREKKYGKKGQELKTKGKFNIVNFVEQMYNELSGIFDTVENQFYKKFDKSEYVLILPKMSGALNYNTIDKLSRLSGVIHGLAQMLGIKVLYVNENSARSRILQNVKGETYKDKAKELSRLENDNLADAFVLAKCYELYRNKEPELFKEF